MKRLMTLMVGVLLAVLVPLAIRAELKPNIVFIMADDLDVRTYERAMPKTQAMVAGEGITFENATYSHSLCCPSRSSILRGQYPHNTGVYSNFPPNGGYSTFYNEGLDADTLGTDLHAAGYRTGYFGKYLNGYGGGNGGEDTPPRFVPPGYDRWFASSSPVQATFINEDHQIVDFPAGQHDQQTADKSLRFIENAAGTDKPPFFASIQFFGPHKPENGPDSYANRFSDEPLPRPISYNEYDMSDKPVWMQGLPRLGGRDLDAMRAEHRDRLRAAAYIDNQVARVISTLEAGGELENTYLVFYSDNGYHLGLHRLYEKTSPYIEDVRFPIVVRGPGIAPGTTSGAMVQNVDLRPTFDQMAGAPVPGYVDGLSFLGTAVSGEPFPRTYAYAEALRITNNPDMRVWKATYTPDVAFHYWFNEGDEELYDLVGDPYEVNNLLAAGVGEETAAEYRRVLDNFATCSGASCHEAGMGR